MERDTTHGPRLDDDMASEVSSLTHGTPIESRADEGRLQEDAPDASIVAEEFGHVPDTLDGMPTSAIRDRTELARHLRPSIFPCGPALIVQCAIEENAPDEWIAALETLPDVTYYTTNDVWVALGGATEEPMGHGEVAAEAESTETSDVQLPRRFSFRWDTRFRLAALPFGVTPGSAFVEIAPGADGPELRASFGPWQVRTPIANIVGATRTGPFSMLKTIGPPH